MGMQNVFTVIALVYTLICGLMPAVARAQASSPMIAIRLQSESFVYLKGHPTLQPLDVLYGVKGESKNEWSTHFQIKGHASKSPAELARQEARKTLARKPKDLYAAALLMASRSGNSIFVDQVRSESGFIESSLIRFFRANNGKVVSYRWIRRLNLARAPASEAAQTKNEIVRFLANERVKRADLIVDLSKKDLPHQLRDDPMGLQGFPIRPRQNQ